MSFFDKRPESVHGDSFPVDFFEPDNLPPVGGTPEDLRRQIDDCERRIASLMWVVGVIRRGFEWQENSPILRLIDKTLADEYERGAPLGPNVARMIPRRRPPSAMDHADLDLA